MECLQDYERAAYEAERSSRHPDQDDADRRIEAANKIVLHGGLGAALVLLVQHAQHWGTWIKRDDFRKWVQFDAEDVKADCITNESGYRKTRTTTIRFSFRGQHYRTIFTDEGLSPDPHDHHAYGSAELWSGDNRVLRVLMDSDVTNDFERWRPYSVEAFRPGAWMTDLLGIAAQISARQNGALIDPMHERRRETAKNIVLSGEEGT